MDMRGIAHLGAGAAILHVEHREGSVRDVPKTKTRPSGRGRPPYTIFDCDSLCLFLNLPQDTLTTHSFRTEPTRISIVPTTHFRQSVYRRSVELS